MTIFNAFLLLAPTDPARTSWVSLKTLILRQLDVPTPPYELARRMRALRATQCQNILDYTGKFLDLARQLPVRLETDIMTDYIQGFPLVVQHYMQLCTAPPTSAADASSWTHGGATDAMASERSAHGLWPATASGEPMKAAPRPGKKRG